MAEINESNELLDRSRWPMPFDLDDIEDDAPDPEWGKINRTIHRKLEENVTRKIEREAEDNSESISGQQPSDSGGSRETDTCPICGDTAEWCRRLGHPSY